MKNSLIKKFKQGIFHDRLFRRGDRVLIGISGGADSVALTRLLLEIREKYSLELFLLHVNYHLRGQDSDLDKVLVQGLASEFGLPLKVVDFDPKGKKESEEVWRDFRHGEFFGFAKKNKIDKIALGHNLDDQAETFLMRVFRGAGLRGLGAMKKRDGKIVRPLLDFEKKDIEIFLKEIGQEFRFDKSNLERKFLRNKIRLDLIPAVERGFCPSLKKKIAGLCEDLQGADEVLEEIERKKYNELVRARDGKKELDLLAFKRLSVFFQGRLFQLLVAEFVGSEKELGRANFEEFMKIVRSEKGKTQEMVFKNVLIIRKANKIIFKTVESARMDPCLRRDDNTKAL